MQPQPLYRSGTKAHAELDPQFQRQPTLQQQLDRLTRSPDLSTDDHRVFKLSQNPKQAKRPSGDKRNLPQEVLDNPPIKYHQGLYLTEFVLIGDSQTCSDSRFLASNKVTHILNTAGAQVPNYFDAIELNNPEVRAKLQATNQMNSPLIGRIKYYTISDWEEHKLTRLTDFEFLMQAFNFIESAAINFSSCLIFSHDNKCASVVVAIIYMMFKFKWNIPKTLEYICSRKNDVEITKGIISQLSKLVAKFKAALHKKQGILRTDWELYSHFPTAFSEQQLSFEDRRRFTELASKRKNVKNRPIFFMGEVFLDAEEEAAIVNCYVNSLKPKKNEKARQGKGEASKEESGAEGAKDMKNLIAEVLLERVRRNEEPKKTIDLSSLDAKVDSKKKKAEQNRYLSTLAETHFQRKKPAVDPEKQRLAHERKLAGFQGINWAALRKNKAFRKMKNVQNALKWRPNRKPLSKSVDFSTLQRKRTKVFNQDMSNAKKQGSDGDLENEEPTLDLEDFEKQFEEAKEQARKGFKNQQDDKHRDEMKTELDEPVQMEKKPASPDEAPAFRSQKTKAPSHFQKTDKNLPPSASPLKVAKATVRKTNSDSPRDKAGKSSEDAVKALSHEKASETKEKSNESGSRLEHPSSQLDRSPEVNTRAKVFRFKANDTPGLSMTASVKTSGGMRVLKQDPKVLKLRASQITKPMGSDSKNNSVMDSSTTIATRNHSSAAGPEGQQFGSKRDNMDNPVQAYQTESAISSSMDPTPLTKSTVLPNQNSESTFKFRFHHSAKKTDPQRSRAYSSDVKDNALESEFFPKMRPRVYRKKKAERASAAGNPEDVPNSPDPRKVAASLSHDGMPLHENRLHKDSESHEHHPAKPSTRLPLERTRERKEGKTDSPHPLVKNSKAVEPPRVHSSFKPPEDHRTDANRTIANTANSKQPISTLQRQSLHRVRAGQGPGVSKHSVAGEGSSSKRAINRSAIQLEDPLSLPTTSPLITALQQFKSNEEKTDIVYSNHYTGKISHQQLLDRSLPSIKGSLSQQRDSRNHQLGGGKGSAAVPGSRTVKSILHEESSRRRSHHSTSVMKLRNPHLKSKFDFKLDNTYEFNQTMASTSWAEIRGLKLPSIDPALQPSSMPNSARHDQRNGSAAMKEAPNPATMRGSHSTAALRHEQDKAADPRSLPSGMAKQSKYLSRNPSPGDDPYNFQSTQGRQSDHVSLPRSLPSISKTPQQSRRKERKALPTPSKFQLTLVDPL